MQFFGASEAVTRGVLKNFAKFAGKQLSESSLNKVAGLRPAILLKKRLATGLSLWILLNFEDHFLQDTSGPLLLELNNQD